MPRAVALIYNASDGEILLTRSGERASVEADVAGRDHIFVEAAVDPATHYVDEQGDLQARPARPGEHYRWDRGTQSWVPLLEDARAAKWEAMKRARAEAEAAGVVFDGHLYDTDLVSQQRIMGACVQAQLDPAASWHWTTADNEVVVLAAGKMLELGRAVAAHVSACHARGRQLRAQIESATKLAEIEAVDWP